MENKELLSIKSVYKEFEIEGHSEHLKVLENIDLTVKTNEFLSIIGQSGTGKINVAQKYCWTSSYN